MKYLYRTIILVLVVITQFSAHAQESLDMAEIEKGVDEYLTYFSGGHPGAVVSVMKKGDIVFNKAYGLANIETQELMVTKKLFNLAELSKSFTALAILKLVEKKKLSLDDNLKEIFNEFPDYGEKIKLIHLLEHKSGLANYNAETVNSNKEVFNFLLIQDKPIFEPGSKFEYSNSDYTVLVNIIEKASGLSYTEYLRKYILDKISMDNTFFSGEAGIKNIASSHFKENDEYVVKSEINSLYGEQGIYINVFDYAKYDKALYTDKLLKCENLTGVFRIGKLTKGENISEYNSGWSLMAKNGVRYFWQGGLKNGYTNMVLHLPDTQITILILTNRNDGYDFLRMSIYIAKLFDKGLIL